MKKIAFVLRLLQDNCFYGGGEKLTYKLISEFINNNYLVDIWCNESNIKTFPGINEIIICDENFNVKAPSCIESYQNKMMESLADKEYDYIITDGIKPKLDITLLQVHTLHNKRFNSKNFLNYFYYKTFKPDKIIEVEHEKKCIQQDHRKIFVVSNKLKEDLTNNFRLNFQIISLFFEYQQHFSNEKAGYYLLTH